MAAVTSDVVDASHTGVGFFCPGTVMANEAGLDAVTESRSLRRARHALTDA